MDSIFFSRDVASLTAQLAAILVIAFVVEFRALARKRALQDRGFNVILLIPFLCFGIVVFISLVVLNGEGGLWGVPALTSWVLTAGSLGLMLFYIAVIVRAMVAISAEDIRIQNERDQLIESRLRFPAWRWLFSSTVPIAPRKRPWKA